KNFEVSDVNNTETEFSGNTRVLSIDSCYKLFSLSRLDPIFQNKSEVVLYNPKGVVTIIQYKIEGLAKIIEESNLLLKEKVKLQYQNIPVSDITHIYKMKPNLN